MSGAEPPRIGLVTDSDINRFALQKLLQEQRYKLVLSVDSQRLAQYFNKPNTEAEPDVWLVDISESVCQEAFATLLDDSQRIVLVNDEQSPELVGDAHAVWCRRLMAKLESVAVNGERRLEGGPEPEHVWLLAASTGGPAAVNTFLERLPAGLPIAMIYAQHIEARFDRVLQDMGSGKGDYPIRLAGGEQRLVAGEVLVVPADHQLRFLPFGRAVKTRHLWRGQFQPAIDQVSAELADVYRTKLSMIVFTGMCNDGEIGTRITKACGGSVWAQTPDS